MTQSELYSMLALKAKEFQPEVYKAKNIALAEITTLCECFALEKHIFSNSLRVNARPEQYNPLLDYTLNFIDAVYSQIIVNPIRKEDFTAHMQFIATASRCHVLTPEQSFNALCRVYDDSTRWD